MTRFVFIIFSGILLMACSRRAHFIKELQSTERKFQDHTGFILYDPLAQKTILEFNASKYFSPASNTKIFTLYTALKILGDSVPALHYSILHDSLVFWGTGDPSFLNGNIFDNGRVYNFLANSPKKLFFSSANFDSEPWGPGWAWDDFSYSYSTERSPFTIFGNIGLVRATDGQFRISPAFFQNHFHVGDSVASNLKIVRETDSNQMTLFPGKKNSSQKSWKVPFHYSSDLLVELLSDTLKRQVEEIDLPQPQDAFLINSIPSDSLYAVMMKNSDNFIAEQLLLLCAGKISDTLNSEIAIRYTKKFLLKDAPDELVWVDGSGLSRYNLFTPRTIVHVWRKIYEMVPRNRLFQLLAVGGQKGTLSDMYKSEKPFIFGKTGSLSNNSSLSGFLLTKKGKVFIFSFMSSNFVASSRDIRNRMEEILTSIRDKY